MNTKIEYTELTKTIKSDYSVNHIFKVCNTSGWNRKSWSWSIVKEQLDVYDIIQVGSCRTLEDAENAIREAWIVFNNK